MDPLDAMEQTERVPRLDEVWTDLGLAGGFLKDQCGFFLVEEDLVCISNV